MQRRTLLSAALFSATAGLAAAPPARAAEPAIARIKSTGTLRVGLSTFVPWSFPDKNGQLVGFEIDVATRLARELGVKLEVIPTAWDAIIPSLIAGKYDVVIGGLTITPERARTVDFTLPYEHSQIYAVVNTKLAPAITAPAQLDSPAVTLAVRRGSTAASLNAFPRAHTNYFDDENTQTQEFVNGNATAVLVSTPSPALLAEEHPALVRILEPPIRQTDEAMAIRKGDPQTREALDAWIRSRTDDGWLRERFDYWFKGRAWKGLIAAD